MIIEGDFAAWSGDRAAQENTARGIEEAARRFRAWAAASGFDAAMEEATPQGAEAVLEAARRLFEAPGAAAAAVEALIAAAAADPFYRPHLSVAAAEFHSGLVLFENDAVTLLLGVMKADAIAAKRAARRGGASLLFTGRKTLFHFIEAGRAILSFWEATPPGPGFTGRKARRCRFAGRRPIGEGETVLLDGRRQAFVVENASRDLVYFQAITPLDAAPLNLEYDSDSLDFLAASSADEAASRVQMMLSFLRSMDRRDAIPLIVAFLASDHFYARWQAMREFLALDADAALPHLRAMAASDPHAEVRDAAAQTLACFFPGEADEGGEEPVRCRA